MSQKIKIFFTNATKLKKITILITLFFVTLGLILPLSPVWAGLEWLPNAIVNFLISVVFQVLIAISGLFLNLACWILGWVTGPSFISAGATANPFVTPAWALVRDLANMGFVIALVAIGLGTALRIGEYRAKKTLPLLIFIALLINFTPVICGVIIDASNIAMNFFLEGGIGFEGIKNTFLTQSSILWGGIKETNFFEKLGIAIAMWAYNIIAGLIFLLFAVLFAARYVALWILVILSPLAFFSYVLPATRNFWKTWWNQFIQWTLIGVTAGFWLYLAEQIMMVRLTGPTPPSEEFGGLSAIFAYTIPIIFLGMGLIASLSITATGTEAIIGGAKNVEGWAKQKGKAWVGERAAGVREKVVKSEGVRRAAERLATTRTPGAGERGFGGWVKRGVGSIWAVPARAIGRTIPGLAEAEMDDINKTATEAEKRSPELNLSQIRSGTLANKIGSLIGAKEGGQIKTLKSLGLTPEEITGLGREALKIHPNIFKKISSAFPHLVEEMIEGVSEGTRGKAGLGESEIEKAKKDFGSIGGKLLATIKLNDIAKLDPEALEKLGDIPHRSWSGREIGRAAQEFGSSFVDTFMEEAEKERKGVDWYLQANPKALVYLSGTAAQDLGFRSIGGLDREDVRKQLRAWKRPAEDIEKEIAQKETRKEELRKPIGRIIKRVPEEREKEAKEIEKEVGELRELLERKRRVAERVTEEKPSRRVTREEEEYRRRYMGQG